MKDKIRARFNEFRNDPFAMGMLAGGCLATGTFLIASHMLHVNYDKTGLYIPEHLIDTMHQNGGAILANKKDIELVIGLMEYFPQKD